MDQAHFESLPVPGYMAAPERFLENVRFFSLAPRAPSIHDRKRPLPKRALLQRLFGIGREEAKTTHRPGNPETEFNLIERLIV